MFFPDFWKILNYVFIDFRVFLSRCTPTTKKYVFSRFLKKGELSFIRIFTPARVPNVSQSRVFWMKLIVRLNRISSPPFYFFPSVRKRDILIRWNQVSPNSGKSPVHLGAVDWRIFLQRSAKSTEPQRFGRGRADRGEKLYTWWKVSGSPTEWKTHEKEVIRWISPILDV